MIVLTASVIATPALAAMRAAVPAWSQHIAACRTAPCRNHRGSFPNAWPNGTPLRPTRKVSARTNLSTQPAGARFGQFNRAPLPQLEPIDRDQLETHSSDANGCTTLPYCDVQITERKKGVSRETPLSISTDRVSDQSLKRPRTPTRLPPPRFSLPELRGWPGRAPCAGRALLPRSP